jgi:hypothetical protein
MNIIAHRGYWIKETDKNKKIAFERAFRNKFGVETDIRDFNGVLVISHDIANEYAMTVNDFFQLYSEIGQCLPLALNIKADGLQKLLKELINKYKIINYFVFDMSIPDAFLYINCGMHIFTRESEFEETPSFYKSACGVWMDEFQSHWITAEKINSHLNDNKKVCIVSPELHKRDHISAWIDYKELIRHDKGSNIFLCTDFPKQARSYFHD